MRVLKLSAAMLLLGTAACQVTTTPENGAAEENAGQVSQQPQQQQTGAAQQVQQAQLQAQQQLKDLRFLVDISDRKLQVIQGDRVLRTEDVAVGTEKWPTPTGKWNIHRVDINPEWVPPKDEEWAEEREPKAAGAPDNPLGKARLVYRLPNTIHGTTDTASLGKAASHGSIRVSNEVVLQLAQMLLQAGGAWQGPQWFQQMVQTPNKEFLNDLKQPIPIEVRE